MAGLFYLPRIYVYHSSEESKSKSYKTFIIMEKIIKYIMNPSFIITFVTGTALIIKTEQFYEIWFISKFILVLSMAVFHMYCAKIRRDFEQK